ncbi:hypothetical protein [Blackfly microvirus SF02]|uniref:Uncharacterized protein n=1 Tax=Blackfly microvirus SF02 TaxID=2576452 RepID=A0A4P8PLV1_9VIRU|nr:hypothetical protein [Blackfly microvirus SF02]
MGLLRSRLLEEFERPVLRPRPLRTADIIQFPVVFRELEDLRQWSPYRYLLAPALLTGQRSGVSMAPSRREAIAPTASYQASKKFMPERAYFGLPQFPYLPAAIGLNPPQLNGLLTHAEHFVRCVKRRQRKEILHAKKHAGKPHRKGKRGFFSGINC